MMVISPRKLSMGLPSGSYTCICKYCTCYNGQNVIVFYHYPGEIFIKNLYFLFRSFLIAFFIFRFIRSGLDKAILYLPE